MMEDLLPRYALMRQLASVRERLLQFGIRDASDYAEVLVSEALSGRRLDSRVNKGYDIVADSFGRIEVKSRQISIDGRVEERVEVGESKEDGFEFLAVVIFHPDFSVKGAVIAPYLVVWEYAARQKYHRISYTQACKLPGAVDITAVVQAASKR